MSRRFNIAFENTEELAGDTALQEELLGEGFNPDDDSISDQIDTAVAIEEIANELDVDINDNDRAIDVADSLGDIQDIVQNTPEDEQVDTNLIQTAANMAVAGTDVNAQDIVPTMESFRDKRVAVEAIGEKIKGALKSVINSAKEIGTKIGNYLKETFRSVSYLEKRATEYRQQLSAIDKKTTATVTFRAKYYLATDDGTAIGSLDEFKSNFVKGSGVFGKIAPLATQMVTSLSGGVKTYITNLAKMDLAKQDEQGKVLYDIIVTNFIKKLKSLPNSKPTDSKNPISFSKRDGTSYAVSFGVGEMNICYTVPEVIPANTADTEQKRQAVTNMNVWIRDPINFKLKNKNKELTTQVKASDLLVILAEVDKNITMLKVFAEKTFKEIRWTEMVGGGNFGALSHTAFDVARNKLSLQSQLINKSLSMQSYFIRGVYNAGYGLTNAGLKIIEQGIRGLTTGNAS